jgi:hypothetical protein
MAQFYVKSRNNEFVPAKVLTDDSGTPIPNPNYGVPFTASNGAPVNWGQENLALYDSDGKLLPPSMQRNLQYFIVPDNFDLQSYLADAITYSSDVVTEGQFWLGPGNFQVVHPLRKDGSISSGKDNFTLAYTDANSFVAGMAQAISKTGDLISDAGKYNKYFGGRGAQGPTGNPLRNEKSQDAGVDALDDFNFSKTRQFLKDNVDNRLLDLGQNDISVDFSDRAGLARPVNFASHDFAALRLPSGPTRSDSTQTYFGAGNGSDNSFRAASPNNLAHDFGTLSAASQPFGKNLALTSGLANNNSFSGLQGSGTSSTIDMPLRNQSAPAPQESEAPLGLVSGQPMRFLFAPIFETRPPSGVSGDAERSNPLDDLISNFGRFRSSSSDPGATGPSAARSQDPFGDGNAVAPSSSGPGDIFSRPTLQPQDQQRPLSLNEAYLEYLKRLNANRPPPFDANASSPPLVPSGDQNSSGGLVGRLTTLLGSDPQNLGQTTGAGQDAPSGDFDDDLVRRWLSRLT